MIVKMIQDLEKEWRRHKKRLPRNLEELKNREIDNILEGINRRNN